MIRFNCDYAEGAHPKILERLVQTNFIQTPGYGEDEFCFAAAERLRALCDAPDAAVHFLVGGTQTNLIVLSAALRPYQGVIAADTGHINCHETGAIEACGHKVLAIAGKDGLLDAADVEEYCRLHFSDEAHEHLVQPGAVYVSQSTELGTQYTRSQLLALRAVCDRYGLILFLDGARLGYAMAAPGNDVDLPFLYRTCDVFYLGGTKQGALFGEAVIIRNESLKKDFRYQIKQRGAMLAKGRLLGIQFDELLKDDLYFSLARHAVEQALRIREALLEKGVPLLVDSRTNQIFPILPDTALESLSKEFTFTYQQRMNETHSAIRFCTSWATRPEDVSQLIAALKSL